jgi:hypothetical protein
MRTCVPILLSVKAAKKLLVASRPTIDSFLASPIAHRNVVVGGIEVFLFDTQPTAPDSVPVFSMEIDKTTTTCLFFGVKFIRCSLFELN